MFVFKIVKDNFYYKPVEYTAAEHIQQIRLQQGRSEQRSLHRSTRQQGIRNCTQVQHTAFNIEELLNLDMNAITTNDFIWIANKSNKDWDVLRITSAGIKIANLTFDKRLSAIGDNFYRLTWIDSRLDNNTGRLLCNLKQ